MKFWICYYISTFNFAAEDISSEDILSKWYRSCERAKSKQNQNQVDLAHKQCNCIIKGWLHCLTSESKERFLVNNKFKGTLMQIWKSVNFFVFIYQFAIFKPLSYCFVWWNKIEFDVKASFTSRTLSRLIRWYNKAGGITKEFGEKAIKFHRTFHGSKITNWYMKIMLKISH